jgi:hypothetical protein
MYKLILCFVMMLFLSGCKDSLRLDNQIKNQIEYKKVFVNSVNSITVLTVEQENPEIMALKNICSINEIKFITGSDKKIITWHTYGTNYNRPDVKSSLGPWDVVVYLTDVNEIEAGELDKGKFGKEKLHEL